MKHNHNHDSGRNHGHATKPVHFEFADENAKEVAIAGSFNDWKPCHKSMRATGKGQWLGEAALAPGTYEYCLVVDGRWMPDPLALETVANPFGGQNSVLKVTTA